MKIDEIIMKKMIDTYLFCKKFKIFKNWQISIEIASNISEVFKNEMKIV